MLTMFRRWLFQFVFGIDRDLLCNYHNNKEDIKELSQWILILRNSLLELTDKLDQVIKATNNHHDKLIELDELFNTTEEEINSKDLN